MPRDTLQRRRVQLETLRKMAERPDVQADAARLKNVQSAIEATQQRVSDLEASAQSADASNPNQG